MKKLSGWDLLYAIPLITGISVCFTDGIFYGIFVFLLTGLITRAFINWEKSK